jgi:general secretion pathway protein D
MKSRLIFLAMAVLSTSAFGQGNPFDFMGGGGGAQSKPAWTEFKLPKKTMKLDFRNASADMVLSLFTKVSGIAIIKDPTLTQPLTLTSAKAVPLEQAFEILNAALSVRNFDLKKEGNLLVIRARRQQNQGRAQGPPTFDPSMLAGLTGGNTELKVYQIQFANASQVARVVNEVFAQSGQNPLSGIMQMVMAGQGGRGGRGGFNPGGGGGSTVKASSDDYSNTVIVNAPASTHRQVEDLIKQIDKQTDEPQKAKVYKMQFASATDLQPVVQGVLTANVPRGRGGINATQQGQGGGGGFPFFGGGGGGQNAARNQLLQGAVVTDQRSNSLVVTTTDKNHILVEEVIKNLDTEIKLESTTFVFPLENARADQIATLMRQAFGQRSGTGNNGGTGQNRNNAGGTGNQNRNNQNRQGGGIQLGGGRADNGNELELALEDQNLNAGELQTNVAVQGGGIFGQLFGGGGQQNQNQNRQNIPLGRDSQGRLVPVQDMTNQITVIPDQNTNSIIVVTTPENAEMLRQILAQLDKIPEQVMIETMIVEATLDSSDKFGIEWQLTNEKVFNNTGVTGTGNQAFGLDRAGQGFRYSLAGGNLAAFMNAVRSDTKFNVLSTPKIFTSNNVTAEINISQRVPFVVSQREDANGNLTFNYDFQDVGIVLTVTPRITSGGYVTMEVTQTANDLQGFTDFNAPIVNQRQAETTIAVKDGETVILGGIMRNTVTSTTKKIPLLGDIPILGNLFKSTDKSSTKTELMVFLTPRVVRNPEEAAKLTEEQKKKMSKPTQDQLNKAGGGSVKTSDTKKAGGN